MANWFKTASDPRRSRPEARTPGDGETPTFRRASPGLRANPFGRGRDPEEEDLPDLQDARSRVHRQLLERLNLSSVANRERSELDEEIGKIVRQLLAQDEAPLNPRKRSGSSRRSWTTSSGSGPSSPWSTTRASPTSW
jgi:hypothetical protein